MPKDAIVEEGRRIREELSAKYDFNVKKCSPQRGDGKNYPAQRSFRLS